MAKGGQRQRARGSFIDQIRDISLEIFCKVSARSKERVVEIAKEG
jgi:hypothetical protein